MPYWQKLSKLIQAKKEAPYGALRGDLAFSLLKHFYGLKP
jgi:hypothetical protein